MSTDSKGRILVVDDEASIRSMLRVCLENVGYDVTLASSGEAGVATARRSPPDLALVDLRMGVMDGLAVIRALAQEAPTAAVVLMTAYATVDNAVDAMRAGAVDYLPKPFTPAQVLHTIDRVLELARVRVELADFKRASGRGINPRFETKSPTMQRTLAIATRVAPTDATVLLLGETGTGKGYLARHIHSRSSRRDRPFITVNCAAIAPSLIESELFGHAKGAFTGADRSRAGYVEAAGNGTLFLDEVGDLPKDAQGKLLRLLEEHEYVRVGDSEPRKSDARIIAATHIDLRTAVAAGTFRQDLYYRLNVVTATVPAVRERREDIAELAASMLTDLASQHRRMALTLAPATLEALRAYAWPGNLRELVNVLERAVIIAEASEVSPDLLPAEVRAARGPTSVDDGNSDTLDAAESRHIADVLTRHPTLDAAAKALRIDPSTLYRKRERFGLR